MPAVPSGTVDPAARIVMRECDLTHLTRQRLMTALRGLLNLGGDRGGAP